MTRLDLVEDSTQSVWNFCGTMKTVCSRRIHFCPEWITALRENHLNIESKSL